MNVQDIQERVEQIMALCHGLMRDLGTVEPPSDLFIGSHCLNMRTGELSSPEGPVHLPPAPTLVLLALARRRGECVSRSRLADVLYDDPQWATERGIDQAVMALRRVLGVGVIVTVHSRGYRLCT